MSGPVAHSYIDPLFFQRCAPSTLVTVERRTQYARLPRPCACPGTCFIAPLASWGCSSLFCWDAQVSPLDHSTVVRVHFISVGFSRSWSGTLNGPCARQSPNQRTPGSATPRHPRLVRGRGCPNLPHSLLQWGTVALEGPGNTGNTGWALLASLRCTKKPDFCVTEGFEMLRFSLCSRGRSLCFVV